MTLTDRFWAWAATRRDRLVTAALDDHEDPLEQARRLNSADKDAA